jgi:hypothetical protein
VLHLLNFYSNENTPQFTQGVFTTIFNATMKTHLSAVLRWYGSLYYWWGFAPPSNPWLELGGRLFPSFKSGTAAGLAPAEKGNFTA